MELEGYPGLRQRVVSLLIGLIDDRLNRGQILEDFQNLVWQSDFPVDGEWDVIHDLAYDLDYYEPDPIERMWEASIFADDRFEEKVRLALATFAPKARTSKRESSK